ncbi:MAG: GAF domain-containing protein [Candidatus Bathyarchaeota archaeon]|nr:GAF domain-containing protein [Candidatus Bathyarchaeota archaeon]
MNGKGVGRSPEEIFTQIAERKTMEHRLSALNLYGKELNTSSSIEKIYELTLDAMEQTLGFQHASFLIKKKDNLEVASSRGYPSPLALTLPLSGENRGITVKAANKRKPVLARDTEKSKDYVGAIPSIRSELAVPVEIENSTWGVLNVESYRKGAFDENDVTLLQILASHAATAISNLQKRFELRKRSNQLTLLMRSSTKMISSTDLQQRLQTIAEAIRDLGWRRVVISVRNENLDINNPEDIVTAGLTEEGIEFLWKNKTPGSVWQDRFGSSYKRFKIGGFYYLPWSDPWVRKRFSDNTVPSELALQEMVDWDPQDLLYAPLRLADGRIVGVLSIDDPIDGRLPTKDSLASLELFIHQAAVAIENCQLINSLNDAREELKAEAALLESKVEKRTRELKKSQEQLIRTQRLAAIGELASMVGHDLRNPLTAIAGATYYLKAKLGPKTTVKTIEMLELIEKEIGYSNKIVSDLLDYSTEMQLEITETTPKTIINEALSSMRIPCNIHLANSARNSPRIRIDVDKMKRVFINIFKNALDSMPEGGKLAIGSRLIGDHLEITVTDSGSGMSKDVLKKIWAPLFTTKAKGMGLGLPICKRIVEAHEGKICTESIVGKGTIFTVNLPIKAKAEGGEEIWVNAPESSLLMMKKA